VKTSAKRKQVKENKLSKYLISYLAAGAEYSEQIEADEPPKGV
jgi:hypothetical protein